MNARRSPGGNQGLDRRDFGDSACSPAGSWAIAFLRASVNEQRKREQHGLSCQCDRCKAARAMALAQSGAEPSLAEIDVHDPAVVRLMHSAAKAIRDERARIELVAAAWFALESLRGRSARPLDLR